MSETSKKPVHTIKWSLSVHVENSDGGKETLKLTQPIEETVSGFGTVRGRIDGHANGTTVTLPGDPKDIKFLLIHPAATKADAPPNLEYAFTKSAKDSERVSLTGPQLFASGAAGWLPTPPKEVYFWNKGKDPVDILIAVGREAFIKDPVDTVAKSNDAKTE